MTTYINELCELHSLWNRLIYVNNGLLSRMKIYTAQNLISQPGPKQAYTFELKLDQRILIMKSH